MGATMVPFFRPDIGDDELEEVGQTLRSGWLTTGPRVRAFETAFQAAVGAEHALAVNSCTAALHLALEALGTKPGDAVLVPTLTFAATAEVVRYLGATPILVDCDPRTLHIDLVDATRKLEQLRSSRPPGNLPHGLRPVGIIPVHVGGTMVDVDILNGFAARHQLWTVDDAAHAFPAAWRRSAAEPWRQCGEDTATISCFSFYANKTITTAEGGMAVTSNAALAARMRTMALHGLSKDAWDRYSGSGTWDYEIVAPGFKYNLTDVAAAIGIHQLRRSGQMRARRQQIAEAYLEQLSDVEEIELPDVDADRLHAWHLFPIRLSLDALAIDRNEFIRELHREGIACSVHWRPLHLHRYYRDTFAWCGADLPVATAVWERLISLPLFSTMTDEERDAVVTTVRALCQRHRRTLAVHSAPYAMDNAPAVAGNASVA